MRGILIQIGAFANLFVFNPTLFIQFSIVSLTVTRKPDRQWFYHVECPGGSVQVAVGSVLYKFI